MIIKFLKYIIGFIKFSAKGGFCEMFINLCKTENIPLWNIKNSGSEITADTSVNGYKNIRKIAKKSGMKMRIVKKCGLRFWLAKNKVRSGLAVGFIAFVLILITLSQFAWRIEVVGNVEIEDAEILSAFEGYGVKTGAEISDLDLKSITEKVLRDMPEISWAKVNKRGACSVLK